MSYTSLAYLITDELEVVQQTIVAGYEYGPKDP